jgi:hypothetical protein
MKSLIVLLVDNDETTDEIDDVIRAAGNETTVLDWTVRVDIPDDYVDYVFRVDTSPGLDPEVRGRASQDRLLF